MATFWTPTIESEHALKKAKSYATQNIPPQEVGRRVTLIYLCCRISNRCRTQNERGNFNQVLKCKINLRLTKN